jgi:PAS domain S-box-containing protein
VETEYASRLLLASLFAIAPEAIIVVDHEHHITHFNDTAETIFGYRRNEVLLQPLGLLLPERFRAQHARRINEFDKSPETARFMRHREKEIFGRHKDGHEFPAEATICKLTLGEKRIYSVLLRDVTERKRSEAHTQFLMRELFCGTCHNAKSFRMLGSHFGGKKWSDPSRLRRWQPS